MSRSPTITRLTSLAQESGACRWPSTSKIAIVEMKHLLPALLLAGLGGHAVGLSEVPPADPPRLFLLGTAGGPIPRQERSQPANALVIGGQVSLIDAGYGLLRQMPAQRLNLGAVRALFLTHHHLEHIPVVPFLMNIGTVPCRENSWKKVKIK